MFHNWCFGYSLQSGVKAVGWSDTIVELLGIVFHILSITPHVEHLNCMQEGHNGHTKHAPKQNSHDGACSEPHMDDLPYEIGMVSIGSGSILVHLVELIIIYVLYQGAQQRNVSKCVIWTRITAILTILDMLIFIGHMVLKKDDLLISYMVPNCLYKCYSLCVVHAFVKESQTYSDIKGSSVSVGGPISLLEYSENASHKEGGLP